MSHELWLLAVAAPFLLFPNSWTPLAFTLIPITWLCRRVALGRFTINTALDVPIGILLIMTLVSLYPSVDLSLSLPSVWRIVLSVAVFYGLVNGVREKQHLRFLTIMLVLAGIGLALVCLAGTDWGAIRLARLPIYERLPRLIRDVEDNKPFNPRIVGMALAALLPVPLSLSLFGRGGKYRVLSVIAVIVMGITLMLTQSMQGALGLTAALLFLGTWWSRWLLICIPLGLGGLGWGLLADGPRKVAEMLLSVDHPIGIGVALRLDMWGRALAMIRDMPYTGIGLNTFPLIQTNFYPGFLLGPEPHAHNLFLQIALDLGLPGLIAFLWLLASFGLMVLRAYPLCRDRVTRALLLGLVAGVLVFLASGTIDTIWTAKPAVILWALLGVAAAVARQADDRKENKSPKASFRCARRALAVVWLPAFIALSVLIVPGAFYLNLGTIQAHKRLIQTQDAELLSWDVLHAAERNLTYGVHWASNSSHVYHLLGRIYGWLGDSERAIEVFSREVELDGDDPMGRYAPAESYLRRVRGERGQDRWDDAIRVYSQWIHRFPERSESYILIAIVLHRHKQDRAQATAVLESGLEKSEPKGPLHCYLHKIQEGHRNRAR